jgi:hypothetical protein
MKKSLLFCLISLSGCATNGIADHAPLATYSSSKPRQAITDCLVDRIADSFFKPHIQQGQGSTHLVFTGTMSNPVLDFVIRDDGTGSTTEFRRYTKITSGKSVAETCF